MKQPKAGVGGQHLEKLRQIPSLCQAEQGALFRDWFG